MFRKNHHFIVDCDEVFPNHQQSEIHVFEVDVVFESPNLTDGHVLFVSNLEDMSQFMRSLLTGPTLSLETAAYRIFCWFEKINGMPEDSRVAMVRVGDGDHSWAEFSPEEIKPFSQN